MSKRKAQTVSYDNAVVDILNWVENPDNDENFELETNTFSDDSDVSDEEHRTGRRNRRAPRVTSQKNSY